MTKLYLAGIGICLFVFACSNRGENQDDAVQESTINQFNFTPPNPTPPPAEEVEETPVHDHENAHASNELMNENSFEDLVSFMESPERAAWQRPDEVVEAMGDLTGKKVMDLGAGTGYFAFRLQEAGAHVIAAEVDDRFLHFLSEKRDSVGISRKDFEVRQVFYDDPLLASGELDVFFSVDTYHHIGDRSRYLKKVYDGIAIGGEVIIVDFKAEHTPHGPPTHLRVKADVIQAELEAAGFDSVKIDHDMLPEQCIVRGLRMN